MTMAKGRWESEPKLVDVLKHDHSSLHGNAEQRQKSDAGGNTEVGAGDQQRQHAADARRSHVGQNQQRPFE